MAQPALHTLTARLCGLLLLCNPVCQPGFRALGSGTMRARSTKRGWCATGVQRAAACAWWTSAIGLLPSLTPLFVTRLVLQWKKVRRCRVHSHTRVSRGDLGIVGPIWEEQSEAYVFGDMNPQSFALDGSTAVH